MKIWIGILFFGVAQSAVFGAETPVRPIEYKQGEAVLEGAIAYGKAKGKLPGMVIIHDWYGMTDYVKNRARQLADLGFVALAADIYGKGVHPKNTEEATGLATKYKSDRALLRARAQAALDVLKNDPRVDPKKLFVMGYCFGGTTALELARSGAPLLGTLSFHGALDTPHSEDAKKIQGRVLAFHGADDPFVPAEQVLAFQDEMRKAKVDWEMVIYGGAVHAFTVPTAGNDPSKGAAYNEKADHRSFAAMKTFLSEVLK